MRRIFLYILGYFEWVTFGVIFNLERQGFRVRDERGAISIELAIVVAILVAIAIAVGAVLFVRARNATDIVPDVPVQSTRFSSGG